MYRIPHQKIHTPVKLHWGSDFNKAEFADCSVIYSDEKIYLK